MIRKKIINGIFFFVGMMGLLLGISGRAAAIVQAPAWKVSVCTGESVECGSEITLLKNPVYQQEQKQEQRQEKEVEQKVALLKKQHAIRQKREKEEKRRLKKKRQARKERLEIMACCGVSMGNEDRKVLERIVEAEAGGEDLHGRMLVANVILNRVRHKDFPSTIKGVVFSHRGSRYQFSPISDGRYYSVTVSAGTKKAVEMALHGKDSSEGALYFMERAYANSASVRWFDRSLKRLFRYGCHEFFR